MSSQFYQQPPFKSVQCRFCTIYLNTREEMKHHNRQHASQSFQCNRPKCKMQLTQETLAQHNAEFHANQSKAMFHNREYPAQISSDIHQQIMFFTQEGHQNINEALVYDALSIKLRNRAQVSYEKAEVLQKQLNQYQQRAHADLQKSYQTIQQSDQSNLWATNQVRLPESHDVMLSQQMHISRADQDRYDELKQTRETQYTYDDNQQYSPSCCTLHTKPHLSSERVYHNKEPETKYFTQHPSCAGTCASSDTTRINPSTEISASNQDKKMGDEQMQHNASMITYCTLYTARSNTFTDANHLCASTEISQPSASAMAKK